MCTRLESSSTCYLSVPRCVALAWPLIPFSFWSTRLGDSMKSSMQLVIQADAPSSSMRAWESESNCFSCVRGFDHLLGHVDIMHVVVVKEACRCFLCHCRLPQIRGCCGRYLRRTRVLIRIFVVAVVHQFRTLSNDLVHRLLGGLCFLGSYGFGLLGVYDSMMRMTTRTVVRQKAASDKPTSSRSTNHRRLFEIANQSQQST